MKIKSNLYCVMDDNNLDERFIRFCFEYHPECVWETYDGMAYCHSAAKEFLVDEYDKVFNYI
jgi:hypothetical protein